MRNWNSKVLKVGFEGDQVIAPLDRHSDCSGGKWTEEMDDESKTTRQ